MVAVSVRANHLPVVVEDHSAIGVSHLQDERIQVIEVREIVGGEAVAKAIVRPRL